ncbi:MAG: UDP-glucose--dolichyl-phosphate glucosyltransferase [Cytophagales bacterium CG12_big_fil_rev_8_21_14_0_65_40_12]|nr:MAG: UDP-glucose--dolichyl-phosphate glucosyltransferase [Cytophagales bacterium CG12_big_fil_rev_8_21_14_0_65_40_12]PIW04187.1 MAG: UDP-glucose--dolichyl-phosphate glucosyltransferase [Cytophagales bacterium CG17_big_fil_post_rev_8_21_14_2_50_40_13]
MNPIVKVVIPAYNEEQSIGHVINDIPKEWVAEIVVVNNGSKDKTAVVAAANGATVLNQPKPGYGNACLMGIDYLKNSATPPDILVFMDGDYSDYPEQLPEVIQPILDGKADFVIGSRALGNRENGSMTFPQIFGNWLATSMMRWFYGIRFTDLGPFRAIRFNDLIKIDMKDKTFGWTVEMQLKAAKHKLRSTEVPVNYKKRIGVSKVSGTVKGTVLAGYKIIFTIFKYL